MATWPIDGNQKRQERLGRRLRRMDLDLRLAHGIPGDLEDERIEVGRPLEPLTLKNVSWREGHGEIFQIVRIGHQHIDARVQRLVERGQDMSLAKAQSTGNGGHQRDQSSGQTQFNEHRTPHAAGAAYPTRSGCRYEFGNASQTLIQPADCYESSSACHLTEYSLVERRASKQRVHHGVTGRHTTALSTLSRGRTSQAGHKGGPKTEQQRRQGKTRAAQKRSRGADLLIKVAGD